MTSQFNRRNILKTGAAALAGAISQPFMGIPALAAYAAGPTVRRNAFTMAASDPILVGYRKAITAMKALPASDPCSWTYQAAIHGTTVTPALTAWNTCHTDSRYFWSWHRMYLYWFERIVRKYSGMYDWALPFWDWANPAQRQLPPAFRIVGSALHDPSRNAAMNDGTGSISAVPGHIGAERQSPARLLQCAILDQWSAWSGPWCGQRKHVLRGNRGAGSHLLVAPFHRRSPMEPVAGARRGPKQSTQRCGLAQPFVHFFRRMLQAGDDDGAATFCALPNSSATRMNASLRRSNSTVRSSGIPGSWISWRLRNFRGHFRCRRSR